MNIDDSTDAAATEKHTEVEIPNAPPEVVQMLVLTAKYRRINARIRYLFWWNFAFLIVHLALWFDLSLNIYLRWLAYPFYDIVKAIGL